MKKKKAIILDIIFIIFLYITGFQIEGYFSSYFYFIFSLSSALFYPQNKV